jgi:hypothetical protein
MRRYTKNILMILYSEEFSASETGEYFNIPPAMDRDPD